MVPSRSRGSFPALRSRCQRPRLRQAVAVAGEVAVEAVAEEQARARPPEAVLPPALHREPLAPEVRVELAEVVLLQVPHREPLRVELLVQPRAEVAEVVAQVVDRVELAVAAEVVLLRQRFPLRPYRWWIFF